MKKLYLFNPENDMALAYGGPYYMPPTNACKMANDLAALAMWYASDGSDVMIPDACQAAWMDMHCPISLQVNAVVDSLSGYDKVVPWGWSASLIHRLATKGLDTGICPSSDQMDRIRLLSSRGTAVDVLNGLSLAGCIGQSERLHSLQMCMDFVAGYPKVLLKAPWSGSGKGIQSFTGEIDTPMQGWVSRLLRTQGYVVGEPFYDKVVDFAMEFISEGGEVRFAGYSLFETDVRGIYKENILASDEEIERRLSVYVPVKVLMQVRQELETHLSTVISTDYEGYLGVDMMICRVPEGYVVHPCVEINLRMNMGVVSRLLYDRFVYPGATGRYVVEFYPNPGEALNAHQLIQSRYPLMIEDNRIKQGYLSLTPVFESSAYQAYIVVC